MQLLLAFERARSHTYVRVEIIHGFLTRLYKVQKSGEMVCRCACMCTYDGGRWRERGDRKREIGIGRGGWSTRRELWCRTISSSCERDRSLPRTYINGVNAGHVSRLYTRKRDCSYLRLYSTCPPLPPSVWWNFRTTRKFVYCASLFFCFSWIYVSED